MNLKKEDIQQILPVNHFESGLILQSAADNSQYFNIETCIIDMKNISLSKEELIAKINLIENLKDCYVYEDLETPLKVRLKEVTLDPQHLSFARDLTQNDIWTIVDDLSITFDIQKPPLYKIIDITAMNGNWVVFAYHHILLDGHSIELILGELQSGNSFPRKTNWIPELSESSGNKSGTKKEKFFLQSLVPAPIYPRNKHLYLQSEQGYADFTTIMNQWAAFLKQASGSDFLCIGEITSCRENNDISQLALGYFIKAVPIDIDLADDSQHIIDQIKESRLAINQGIQSMPTDGQRFDHVWVLQPAQSSSGASADQYRSRPDYLLSLVIHQKGGDYYVKFIWNLAKIDEQVAREIFESFSIYTRPEVNQKVPTNRESALIVEKLSLLEYWEEVIHKFPERTAIVETSGREYSYREIDQLSSNLATKLNVNFQEKVGISTSYSADIIINMLACLKAKAVFVPIDQYAYKSKKEHIINNSNLNFILTDQGKIEKVSSTEMSIDLNKEESLPIAEQSIYILYTSGSTGVPKGCEIKNANLCNLIAGAREKFQFKEDDTWILAHSYGFDFSIWEIWGALLNGAKLIIPKRQEVRDVFKFVDILNEYQVTILNQTPQAFQSLLEVTQHTQLRSPVRYIIYGGDKLNYNEIADWHNANKNIKLVNMYGITETTIHVTFKELTKKEPYSNIGTPLPGYKILLVNHKGEPVPDGFIGEAIVSGGGVCRGYYNDTERTQNAFLGSRKSPEYRSGDYLWKMGVDFFYLGRKDRQVKIRGYRIELSEIEFILESFYDISFAVIFTGDKKLVSFYSKDQPQIKHEELAQLLPDYAIPGQFIFVDEFPMNNNNKIDFKKLEQTYIKTKKQSIKKNKSNSKDIFSLFGELLGKDLDDQKSFIQNGGDSIKAIRLVNKLKQVNLTVSIEQLLGESRIKDLKIDHVNEKPVAQSQISIVKQMYREYFGNEPSIIFPLLESQKGMLYESLANFESSVNLEQFVIELDKEYSIESIIKAYNNAKDHFIATRCRLIQLNHEYFWVINGTEELSISTSHSELQLALKNDIEKGFNLFESLMRLTIVNENESIFLILSHHHIISDGWSMAAFLKAMLFALKGVNIVQEFNLDKLAFEEQDRIKTNSDRNITYWRNRINQSNISPLIHVNYPSSQNSLSNQYHTISVSLPLPTLLQQKSRLQTNSSIVFSAWLWFLAVLFEHKIVSSGLVYSMRANSSYSEFGNLIRTIPFQAEINETETFSSYLSRIHKLFLEDYSHLDIPTEDIPGLNILSNHIFVYENYPIASEIKEFENIKSCSYTEHTSSDWTTIILPSENKLDVRVIAKADRFTDEFIKSILNHFKEYLVQLHDNSQFQITKDFLKRELDRRGEQKESIGSFAQFSKPDRELYQNFDIINGAGELVTFQSLLSEIQTLSSRFLAAGADKGFAIGIDVSDTLLYTVCIFATWAIDCVICPVDNSIPAKRKEAIYENAQVIFVVTEDRQELKINSYFAKEGSQYSPDTSFILHTSGSTGTPKGVLQTKRCLVNLCDWTKELWNNNSKERLRILQLSSFGFDASLHEILLTYLSEGILVTIPKEFRKDIRKIKSAIIEHKINMVWIPARVINEVLLSDQDFFNDCISLESVVVTGEQCYIQEPFRNLIKKLNLSIYNFYGPTETHVITSKLINSENISYSPNIGKPIQNCNLSIRTASGERSYLGMPGELWISGHNNAIGYLNNDSRDKFLVEAETQWYRTGDIVQMERAAELRYIRRIDDQIKIRGQRVELKEIDFHLQTLEPASNFKTVWHKSNELLLSFYIGKKLDETSLRHELSAYLPNYMIPDSMFYVEGGEYPKNSNGKVDSVRLIELYEKVEEENGKSISYSNSHLKARIAWEHVLNSKSFPIGSTFQSNGGNSIKLMRLQAYVHKKHGVSLSLSDLQINNTLESLGAIIESKVPLTKEVPSIIPLNRMQLDILNHEMILDEEGLSQSPYYLMESFHLPYDRSFIKDQWIRLLEYYKYLTYSIIELNQWRFQDFPEDRLFNEFDKDNFFENAPYIRLVLKTNSVEVYWHHIILDGVSFKLFMSDFLRLLKGETISFIDYNNLIELENRESPAIYSSNKKSVHFEYTLQNNDLKNLHIISAKNSSSIQDLLILALSFANDNEAIGIALYSKNARTPWLNSNIRGVLLNHEQNDDLATVLKKYNQVEYSLPETPILYVTNFLDYSGDPLELHTGDHSKTSICKFKYEFQWILTSEYLKINLIAEDDDSRAKDLFESFKIELAAIMEGERSVKNDNIDENELTEFNFL